MTNRWCTMKWCQKRHHIRPLFPRIFRYLGNSVDARCPQKARKNRLMHWFDAFLETRECIFAPGKTGKVDVCFAPQFWPFHSSPKTPKSGRPFGLHATAWRPRLPMMWHSPILSAWQDRNICRSSLRSAVRSTILRSSSANCSCTSRSTFWHGFSS